jgi:ATP-dependent helicase HrpA
VVRYLHAMGRRLDKLADAPGRDAATMARVHALEDAHDRLLQTLRTPERRAEARRLRWMLEELRVSLFAQSVGPAYRVSEERLRRAFAELERGRDAGHVR